MDFHYDSLPAELFLPFFTPYIVKQRKRNKGYEVRYCPFHKGPDRKAPLVIYSYTKDKIARAGFLCFSCGMSGTIPLIPLLFLGYKRGLEWLIENYPFPLNLSLVEKEHIEFRILQDIQEFPNINLSSFNDILTNPQNPNGNKKEFLPLFAKQ